MSTLKKVLFSNVPSYEAVPGDDKDPDQVSKQAPAGWKTLLVGVILCSIAFGAGRLSGDKSKEASRKQETLSTTLIEDPVVLDSGLASLEKESSLHGLKYGAVAADHEVCSKLGSSILAKGGNAVDAAVTTVLCLGVANPASSGLGGGAFILVHSSKAHHDAWFDPDTSPSFEDARDGSFPFHPDMMTEVIDCRETAPGAASQDMFADLPDLASAVGPLSIAVPGELRGMELVHARHGSMSWQELVEPVVELARDGIPVSAHLAEEIEMTVSSYSKLGDGWPALRKILTKKDSWDTPLKEGELLRNVKLSETLDRIAREGSKALYEGELAEALVSEVQEAGGILSTDDMANYKPVLRSPVYGTVSGFTLVGVPPPSSGGATLIGAARFLSGYDLPFAGAKDTLSVHRMVEAMRHAFAIRMSLSDPAYYTNETSQAVGDLTLGPYMESLRRITKDNTTLSLSQYGGTKWAQLNDTDDVGEIKDRHEGDRRLRGSSISARRSLAREFGYLEDNGTSHLSIVDKDGNSVAITSSVNQLFGSLVMSPTTGVVLGDTMDDFGNPGRSNFYGLTPSKENFIAPGKRPLSSMSPTMVFRRGAFLSENSLGKLELVVGGSGGPKIITAVLQVILNYCFLGWPLFAAVVRPRVHDQLLYHDAAVTTVENSVLEQGPSVQVSQRTKDALLHRGHDALLDIDYAGTVQAVSIDQESNLLTCVCDVRKGGVPAGNTATQSPAHPTKTVSKKAARKKASNNPVEKNKGVMWRPPVVTVMGHVDHGKTTLLDTLRNTRVAKGEAGGITQRIGAYQVEHNGKAITFIDTPGHAAFKDMRQRGANVTDIVVLVVAADDGVKPQTQDSIVCARQAGVPLVVAINKIDLPEADPDRIIEELMEYDVLVEEVGGDILSAKISAKSATNLDGLLDAILMQAELQELESPIDEPAKCVVLEANVQKGIGPVATVLVNSGTLRIGDYFASGETTGKVRTLFDTSNPKLRLKKAIPSQPVRLVGCEKAPEAGDPLVVVPDLEKASELAEEGHTASQTMSYDAFQRDLFNSAIPSIGIGKEVINVPIVLKGDSQGSIEAIARSLEELKQEHSERVVQAKVISSGVGDVVKGDIAMASTAQGSRIIAFDVGTPSGVLSEARNAGVQIDFHNIIYEVIESVEEMMKNVLSPKPNGVYSGSAKVQMVFSIGGTGNIAGSKCVDGSIKMGSTVRVMRGPVVRATSTVQTLRSFKENVQTVEAGNDCGIGLADFEDFEPGDIIECYT
eukprot:Nitzschia sp. Nitz4//scaffold157_size52427//14180//19011//NITZ4_006838-RA/size52427-processed-gene-0.22-mRNA-1//1//CDS//3329537449//3025//frame0